MALSWVHGALGVGGLLVGLAVGGSIGLSGNALGFRDAGPGELADIAPQQEVVEAPIQFDLSTDNYVGTHNFQVKIEGIDVINSEVQAVSGVSTHTTARGVAKYDNVTIERTYKGEDDLYDWWLDIKGGTKTKRDVTITMMDSGFQAIRAATLDEALIVGWTIPTKGSNDPEVITFAVTRVRETSP